MYLPYRAGTFSLPSLYYVYSPLCLCSHATYLNLPCLLCLPIVSYMHLTYVVCFCNLVFYAYLTCCAYLTFCVYPASSAYYSLLCLHSLLCRCFELGCSSTESKYAYCATHAVSCLPSLLCLPIVYLVCYAYL